MTEDDANRMIFNSIAFQVDGCADEAEIDADIETFMSKLSEPDAWTVVGKNMYAEEVETPKGATIQLKADVQCARVVGLIPWPVVQAPEQHADH